MIFLLAESSLKKNTCSSLRLSHPTGTGMIVVAPGCTAFQILLALRLFWLSGSSLLDRFSEKACPLSFAPLTYWTHSCLTSMWMNRHANQPRVVLAVCRESKIANLGRYLLLPGTTLRFSLATKLSKYARQRPDI